MNLANPELRRNLWMELSLHRLVAMPVFLALVLGLVAAASDDAFTGLANASAIIAAGLLGIWGSRSASECVAEEVRNRTWDGQRMSAIGPWTMAWGKLLGATAFSWYGGLMALAVLLLAAPSNWHHAPTTIAALIVACSLLLQAMACLGGLAVARKGYGRRGGTSGWAAILLLFVFGPGLFGVFSETDREIVWWDGRHGATGFMLASALAFAAWAVVGVYRSMAAELQLRSVPWVFASFVLFLAAYVAGFWIHDGPAGLGAVTAFAGSGLPVAMAATYLLLFSEGTGVVVVRRVMLRLARGEGRRALEELPCWAVGLALATLFALAAPLAFEIPATAPEWLRTLSRAPLPLLLLLVRDVAVYLFFAFAHRPVRVEAAVVFYLAMLYGVLPGLLSASGLRGIADMILPPVLADPGKALVVATIQAAIACALVTWRWRRQSAPAAAT